MKATIENLYQCLYFQYFNPLFQLSEAENKNAISVTEQRRCRHGKNF